MQRKVHYCYLLSPTNEVWGKVMFLHVSVILFTEGRGWLPSKHHRSYDQGEGVCIQRRVLIWWGGGPVSRGSVSRGRGALHPGWCLQGVGASAY